jgi:exodeoxyribonuclease VII large subunit
VDKLQELIRWRDAEAKREGIENYLVLGNATLEEIARINARTEAELLTVKGFKDKKLAKYGRAILAIMNAPAASSTGGMNGERAAREIIGQNEKDRVFSVSVFLDLINTGLRTFRAKVRGEVCGVTERGGHFYFDLKDKEDGSLISCLIWNSNYRLSGVELKDGLEIVAYGRPAIYKPNGRLSFQAETIELLGDGALKKQFDELKAKLEKEGLFSPAKKKPIPLFPSKIGLITSRQGEAIHDFLTNLGRFGFEIRFIDSRVEGAQAVPSLLSAIRQFKKTDIDVLVLVRGGGSLESLLSFNNEALVREVANFGRPVVSGIGHEQDVSLVDLAADRSCSTPTGAAKLLSYSWEQARAKVDLATERIRSAFRSDLSSVIRTSDRLGAIIKERFRDILAGFRERSLRLKQELARLRMWHVAGKESVSRAAGLLRASFSRALLDGREKVAGLERLLAAADPARQLNLGFSLTFARGKLLRSVKDISPGDEITLQLNDGNILSEIKEIKKHQNGT